MKQILRIILLFFWSFSCENNNNTSQKEKTDKELKSVDFKDGIDTALHLRDKNAKPIRIREDWSVNESNKRLYYRTLIYYYQTYCIIYHYLYNDSLKIIKHETTIDSCLHDHQGRIHQLYHYYFKGNPKTKKFSLEIYESQRVRYDSNYNIVRLDLATDKVDGVRPDFIEDSYYKNNLLVRREVSLGGQICEVELFEYDNMRRRQKQSVYFQDFQTGKLDNEPFEIVKYTYDNRGNQIIHQYSFFHKKPHLEETKVVKYDSANKKLICPCFKYLTPIN